MNIALKWILGIFSLIASIVSFSKFSVVTGLCFLLVGIICTPPILSIIEGKINTRLLSWQKYVAVIVCFALGITFAPKESKEPNQSQTQLEQIGESKVNTDIKDEIKPIKRNKLDYQIIYELNDHRADGGKSLFVFINKVDLSSSNFKDAIKLTIDDIVKKKGRNISIDFINNRQVLDLFYRSHYGKNELGRILTKSEDSKLGSSLIASFSGEFKNYLYYNTLDFFPGNVDDDSTLSKYVESVEYNPLE
jgi:hypothetical protein